MLDFIKKLFKKQPETDANDELYSDFVQNLDGMSQQDLINLFFDWYDWWVIDQNDQQMAKLRELRKRINIYTTTGIKEDDQ